jgi:hypothetical protein
LVYFVQTKHARNIMHEEHRQAAEQHEHAARAHRTAAEHNERGESEPGEWHAERALEFSDHAYKLAKNAHNKSGQIEALSNEAWSNIEEL